MVDTTHDMRGLGVLIRQIADDQFSIPDFQREFVWDGEGIRQLTRSLFNEYSIGSLLFWKLHDPDMQDLLGCESLLALHQASSDADEASGQVNRAAAPPLTVLDGQQRLTAMYYAFFDHDLSLGGKALRFFVDIEKFMSRKPNEPAEDSAFICRDETRRGRARPSSMPEDSANVFEFYDETQQHEFPLRLLSTGDDGEWLSEYRRFWDAKVSNYEKRAKESEQRAQTLFQQAHEAEATAGEEYAAHFKTREQSREAAKAAEQEAVGASGAVAAQQAKVDDLRKDYHRLDDLLKQSSNSAKKRQYGTQRHQLDLQISREESTLTKLKNTADQKRTQADRLTTDMHRIADAEQSMADSSGQPDPVELRVNAYDQQEAKNRYMALARDAQAHVQNSRDFRDHITRVRENVRIPVMTLPEDVSEVAVSDTFQQINRRGTKLGPFELLNAAVSLLHVSPRNMFRDVEPIMKAEGLLSERYTRTDLIRMVFVRAHPESRYETEGDAYEDLVPGMLRTGSNLAAPLIKTAKDFEAHWDNAQQSYLLGLRALREETHYGKEVPDNPGHFVPFRAMIPVYCCLLADAGESVTRRLRTNQWYWASVLTERYSSDDRRTQRVGARDYREVRAWFTDDDARPDALKQFCDKFGLGLFERTSSGFAKGVRNLMFTFTPHSWLDGKAIPSADVLEYDFVPLERCREIGVPDDIARSPFNTMLVDQASQEEIEENLPNAYIPRFLQERALGFRRELLASHCISDRTHEILLRDPFTSNDLTEFLRERQAEFLRRIALEVFAGLDLELPE